MYPIYTPPHLNKDAGIQRNLVSLTLCDIFLSVYLHMYCTDDTKSSPDSATHLRWDDPYYDIARHQIVEVAGTVLL